jgi:aspartyl-tRNA(Asn)/glutamyl-tRNA(Gln) amidotransferase subunit C
MFRVITPVFRSAMALSLDDVRRIAYLARIELTAAETEATLAKLTGIFGLIEAMQKIDTEGIEPMSHAQEFALRLREDRVTESDRRAAFQALAPDVDNGLYLVPKVID